MGFVGARGVGWVGPRRRCTSCSTSSGGTSSGGTGSGSGTTGSAGTAGGAACGYGLLPFPAMSKHCYGRRHQLCLAVSAALLLQHCGTNARCSALHETWGPAARGVQIVELCLSR
jgi:hypothetical protein